MPESTRQTLLLRYQRVIEISRDLASTLDLDILLDRIVHAAAELCHAAEASILLFDQAKGELYFQAATNLSDPFMAGLSIPVDNSLAGWIVTNREAIILSDARQDARHFHNIAQVTNVTTTSLLGVPMITKDTVVGALEVINKLTGHFDEDDQEILMTLGAQAAVAIQNARLFQQSDLISEFVHEIRTPLSSLNTAAHLLVHPQVPEDKRQEFAELIKRETSRLSEMSTSFLNIARLESGRSQFQIETINPSDLLKECAAVMRPQAEENGLKLVLLLPLELPSLRADSDKLKQAVINLLSNAIKYNSEHGTVTLAATTEEDQLAIRVSDTGIGIPAESQDQLFTKFFRVPGSETHAQGTGLGLSIVKRIIEGHKGKIEVTSQTNQGTTFTLRLPLRQGE